MIDEKDKILLGSSLPLPEVDPEDNENRPEEAFKQFVTIDILENIGKPEFEIKYKSSLDIINSFSNEEKIAFCRSILDKISEVYNYEFPMQINLFNLSNVNSLFKFIEFTEFRYIPFLAELWKIIKVDLRNIDIENFVKNNILEIIKTIDSLLRKGIFFRFQLINLFLGTINKDDLRNFIINKTINSKMEIILEMNERSI